MQQHMRTVRTNERPNKTNGQIHDEWPLLNFGHSPIQIFTNWWMAMAIRQFWSFPPSEWPWPFTNWSKSESANGQFY